MIEPDPSRIPLGEWNFPLNGLSGNFIVHYFIADAENIPVKSGLVDAAIFSGILTTWKIPTL